MGGFALGRLWDNHPKLAAVLHTMVCLLFAALLTANLAHGDWGTAAIFGVGFVVMAALLALFSFLAFRSPDYAPDR